MVKFSIISDVSGITQAMENRASSVRQILERQVLDSCEPYVPYNTGNLCRSGKTSGGYVIWDADYASDCYYANRSFNKKHHPKACARWFEAAKSENLENWKRTVIAYFT